MYRKTHQSDSEFGKHQKEYSSNRDSYFIHSCNDIFDNDSIDHSANFPIPNYIQSHQSSTLSPTGDSYLSLFDKFDDVRFDPTNFTQVEDMLLPSEKDDDYFSKVFWHLENTYEDDTTLLDSNSTHDALSFLPEIPVDECEFLQINESHNSDCLRRFENMLAFSSTYPNSNGHNSGSDNTNVNGNVEVKCSDVYPSTMLGKPGRKPAPLNLTEDEKYILKNEGVVLPENVRTLTKTEERHIKQVKRRIKNKISAAESRKRKKNYLDGLEERVEQTTSINCELRQRVGQLEKQNIDLLNTVKRMKVYVSNHMPKIPESNSALLLFIFAFILFSVPSWISLSNTIQPHLFNHQQVSLTSRTLLSEEHQFNS